MNYLDTPIPPPHTWIYWRTRLRARRVSRARERRDVDEWLTALQAVTR